MFSRTTLANASVPFLVLAGVIATMSACGSSSNNNTTPTPTTPTCTVSGGQQYVQDTNIVDQNACSHLMFAKYQIGVFTAVNGAIITQAANANQVNYLGDSFQTEIVDKGSARIDTFTSNLKAFLVNAFGNSTDPNFLPYTGPTIPSAHAALNITEAQYDYFVLNVIAPALAGADASDVTNCFAPVVLDPNFKVQVIACQ